MKRRDVLKAIGLGAAAAVVGQQPAAAREIPAVAPDNRVTVSGLLCEDCDPELARLVRLPGVLRPDDALGHKVETPKVNGVEQRYVFAALPGANGWAVLATGEQPQRCADCWGGLRQTVVYGNVEIRLNAEGRELVRRFPERFSEWANL